MEGRMVASRTAGGAQTSYRRRASIALTFGLSAGRFPSLSLEARSVRAFAFSRLASESPFRKPMSTRQRRRHQALTRDRLERGERSCGITGPASIPAIRSSA